MTCPICKLNAKYAPQRSLNSVLEIKCARCGTFEITFTAKAIADLHDPDYRLSAWLRSRRDSREPIRIDSVSIESIPRNLPSYRPSEKQLILIRELERATVFPGMKVSIGQEFDFPLAWSSSTEELNYIIRALMGRALVELDKFPDPKDSFSIDLTITPKGWDFLDSAARTSAINNQVFVAMAFAPELLPAWNDGIRKGLSRAKYSPYRIDAVEHLERIDAKIIAEIRNSRFLVADVTYQRPGVYFEAGYAAGIGIPVVWTVRKDDLANVHFDTRQFSHVVWETEEDLAEQLYYRVMATIGPGAASY